MIYLAVAVALFVLWRVRGSKWGFALEAIREDEPAARTLGIPTTGYKLAMLVLGAALAGLAGGLEAHFTFMVAPNGFGFSRVVDMLVFAVVGGAQVFWGAGGRRRLPHRPAGGAARAGAAGGHRAGPAAAAGERPGAAAGHPLPARPGWCRCRGGCASGGRPGARRGRRPGPGDGA